MGLGVWAAAGGWQRHFRQLQSTVPGGASVAWPECTAQWASLAAVQKDEDAVRD